MLRRNTFRRNQVISLTGRQHKNLVGRQNRFYSKFLEEKKVFLSKQEEKPVTVSVKSIYSLCNNKKENIYEV